MSDYNGQFDRLLLAHRKLILEHAQCQKPDGEPNFAMKFLLAEASDAAQKIETLLKESKTKADRAIKDETARRLALVEREGTKLAAQSGRIQGLQNRVAELQGLLAEAVQYIEWKSWGWQDPEKFAEYLQKALDSAPKGGTISK